MMGDDYKPKLTEKEILEAFPEAKEIIPLKLQELTKEKKILLNDLVKPYLEKTKTFKDDFSRWFWREGLKVLVGDRFEVINQNISRLSRLQTIIQSKAGAERIANFEATLEIARGVPIYDIVSSWVKLRKSGKKYFGLCPFHNERSPSFFIYPESNSFYCWGCLKGGDVIKFVMLKQGVDFKQAVKFLNGGK